METTTQKKPRWHNHPSLQDLWIGAMIKLSISIVPINLMESVKVELTKLSIYCQTSDFEKLPEIEEAIRNFPPFRAWLITKISRLPQPLDLELCTKNAARIVAFGCLMLDTLQYERSDLFLRFSLKK